MFILLVLYKSWSPKVVNDGVTISCAIKLADPMENAGAAMILELMPLFEGDDESIVNIIAEAIDKVGSDGVLSIESSSSFETTVNVEKRMEALLESASLIAHNAGVEGDGLEGNGHLDSEYQNLVEAGVIDPAKVTCWLLCISECIFCCWNGSDNSGHCGVDKPKKKVAAAPGEMPEGALSVQL